MGCGSWALVGGTIEIAHNVTGDELLGDRGLHREYARAPAAERHIHLLREARLSDRPQLVLGQRPAEIDTLLAADRGVPRATRGAHPAAEHLGRLGTPLWPSEQALVDVSLEAAIR